MFRKLFELGVQLCQTATKFNVQVNYNNIAQTRQVKVVEWSDEEEIPIIARWKDHFNSMFSGNIWEIVLPPGIVETNLDDLFVWTIVFLHSLNGWLMLLEYGVHIK